MTENRVLVAKTDEGEIVFIPISSIATLICHNGVHRLAAVSSGGYIEIDDIVVHTTPEKALIDYNSRNKVKK